MLHVCQINPSQGGPHLDPDPHKSWAGGGMGLRMETDGAHFCFLNGEAA